MSLVDLASLYRVIKWHEETSGENAHVGVFATVPSELADQFPEEGKTGEDSSPPHVTVCYMGDVPEGLKDKVVAAVEEVTSQFKPFKVRFGPVRKFKNDNTVYYSSVKGKALCKLHEAIKHAFLSRTIPYSHKDADREYKPHVTIEYVDPGEKPQFKHLKPEGEWIVKDVWVWGFGEPHLISLGK